MIGMNWKIRACTGSGGVGFRRICSHIDRPIMIGQAPSCRKGGRKSTENGIRPNRLNTDVGSGADRSVTHPKKGAWRISMVTKSTL